MNRRSSTIFTKRFLGLVLCFHLLASVARAEMVGTQKESMTSLRRNIATVMFFGIGGAVLGLSTLSFYPDPSNHISNITTGLGLGLVGGVAYITSDTWQRPATAESDIYRELRARDTRPQPAMARFTFEF